MSEVEQLRGPLPKTEQQLRAEKSKSAQVDLLETSMQHTLESGSTPVYVTTSQKQERFRNNPNKSVDPEIEGVRSQIKLRRIKEGEQAVCVLNHLAGPARSTNNGTC